MIIIRLSETAGSFAENKDIAQGIRIDTLVPALDAGQEIILDFQGVEGTTQSFVHALISDLIRNYGSNILDKITFKNCNDTVQKIIGIVVDYMQESA